LSTPSQTSVVGTHGAVVEVVLVAGVMVVVVATVVVVVAPAPTQRQPAEHRPGHAASPPATDASQASPAATSSVPSPHVNRRASNCLGVAFFALRTPDRRLQSGFANFALSRTRASPPHRFHFAVTRSKVRLAITRAAVGGPHPMSIAG
jgi:hypothetical protein